MHRKVCGMPSARKHRRFSIDRLATCFEGSIVYAFRGRWFRAVASLMRFMIHSAIRITPVYLVPQPPQTKHIPGVMIRVLKSIEAVLKSNFWSEDLKIPIVLLFRRRSFDHWTSPSLCLSCFVYGARNYIRPASTDLMMHGFAREVTRILANMRLLGRETRKFNNRDPFESYFSWTRPLLGGYSVLSQHLSILCPSPGVMSLLGGNSAACMFCNQNPAVL